jgi:hypothetical protein
MAKKEQKRSKAEEAKDQDEAEGHDEVSEDETDAPPAPARPASAEERRARMREQRRAAPIDHGHDDHGHEDHAHDEDHVDYSNDSTWWVPHAVLGALVLLGVLGFFGAFNKIAEKLGYRGMSSVAAVVDTATTSKPAETKAPDARSVPRPNPHERPQPTGETFGAKHLLVMYKGSMRAPATITRTKEEAKTRAEEALKKAKAGTKFEDLVKEYSDEPGAGQRGGDLGTFQKGQMAQPFQDGVEKTKVGEMSGLVETAFGYHIIVRTK